MFRAQLKKKILENRNICSKNKDLFSLLNSQQIQFTNILTSVRMASEGNLVTDRRYKVTFNNSREDKKFKEWMKKLKEKFNKTREFNFDLSHIWHEFSMKGKMVTMNTSRSAVSSDISETTENDDNTDLYKTRLDVSLYSKAIQGNLNNTMLKDYFKKDDKRFSSTESNYDKSGKTLMLLSPNTLSSKVRIKDTPRKIQNYFSGNSGVIEDIEEESEYPQKILKRPIYGVDYIEFDHFENQEKVVKSYKKKMEHKLIREIFNLMIEKGKIPRIFKGEKNMNIKLVLIKRYCYK